jgi:hypothetical protein
MASDKALALSDLAVAIGVEFREEEGMTSRRGRSSDRFFRNRG